MIEPSGEAAGRRAAGPAGGPPGAADRRVRLKERALAGAHRQAVGEQRGHRDGTSERDVAGDGHRGPGQDDRDGEAPDNISAEAHVAGLPDQQPGEREQLPHHPGLLGHPVDTPYGRIAHATDPLGTLFTIIRLPEQT